MMKIVGAPVWAYDAVTMEEPSQNLCDGKSFCLMGREYREYQEARGRKEGRYDCSQQES